MEEQEILNILNNLPVQDLKKHVHKLMETTPQDLVVSWVSTMLLFIGGTGGPLEVMTSYSPLFDREDLEKVHKKYKELMLLHERNDV